MKTLQLIGPVTGLPDRNKQTFNAAARHLRDQGYDVWSPVESPDDLAWHEAMRLCIEEIPRRDALVALAGWEQSLGASLEALVAVALKKPILHLYSLQPIDITELRKILADVLPVYQENPHDIDEADLLLLRYKKQFEQHLHYAPLVRPARDMAHMKDAVQSLGLEAATEWLHYFFNTWIDLDDFAAGNPVPGTFVSCIPKMQQHKAGRSQQDDRPFSTVLKEKGYVIIRRDGIPIRAKECPKSPDHMAMLYQYHETRIWGCSQCRITREETSNEER